VILNRQRFVNVLNVLGTAVGNKILAVANFVQFQVDRENRRLLLSTTDFNAFLTVNFGDLALANLDDLPEVFLVDYRLLSSIVKASTTETVDIKELKQNGPIVIITNGQYELPRHHDPAEFPASNYSCREVGRWPVTTLLSAWNKAVVAVSNDVTKINYQGVNFDGSFAATDNRRLSAVLDLTKYEGDPVLLMPNFGDVLKQCRNEVRIGISDDKKKVILICDEIGLIAAGRLIDAKFAPYRTFLESREDGVQIVLNKSSLLGVLNRLMVCTDQIYKTVGVKLTKQGEEMEVSLSVNNKAVGVESFKAKSFSLPEVLMDAGDGVVCDHRYHLGNLLDGISVTEHGDEVNINVEADGKMWIEEQNFMYLLTKIAE
jgi:DNA polymerase III sliding clamp (beta) subunit (PCNA family)